MVVWLVPSCLNVSPQLHQSHILPKKAAFRKYRRKETKQACIKRPQIFPTVNGDAVGLRVFVLSDLHTDYSENMKWVKSLSALSYKKDVLLVAGDVAETYDNFVVTMSTLKDRFEHVFFVPGNHDLWCRSEKDYHLDSLEKLNDLLDACRRVGVETSPMVIDGLGIIPLFSWYHESFDKEDEIAGLRVPSLEMVIHFLFSLYVRTSARAIGQKDFRILTPPLLCILMI